jgi:hypothetical protein
LFGIGLESRHELFRRAEQTVREGVWLAPVGLLARRTKALTGIWPLVIPLAPYAAAAI